VLLSVSGTVPIPGAKHARQAEQKAGALVRCLTPDEMARMDEASTRVHGQARTR